MTQTAIDQPPARRTASALSSVRRVIRNLSVGTVSLLVLVGAGLYVVSPPAQVFALSAAVVTTDPSAEPVVYGTITQRNGRPDMASVTVSRRDSGVAVATGTTQPDGTYRIVLPRFGKYVLTVSNDHAEDSLDFTIREGTAIRIDAVRIRHAVFSIGPVSSY